MLNFDSSLNDRALSDRYGRLFIKINTLLGLGVCSIFHLNEKKNKDRLINVVIAGKHLGIYQ